MPQNIEIKARLSTKALRRVRAAALARSDLPPVRLTQTDTFFVCQNGRLKLRELDSGKYELIAYDRADVPGPARSDYTIFRCADSALLRQALSRSLGVYAIVRKQREVVMIGQTRVHLDVVENLGNFLELEVVLKTDQPAVEGEAIANQLLVELGVTPDALIDLAYVDLLAQSASSGS